MRPEKSNYYLEIATTVAKRATCLRRKYGAIILKNDRIISTGYCGAPRGFENCCDLGHCKREQLNVPAGQRYELCRSVHAEANSIIAANGQETIGATLYLAGIDGKTGDIIDAEPCMMCRRMIIQAGIKEVICQNADGTYKIMNPMDFEI